MYLLHRSDFDHFLAENTALVGAVMKGLAQRLRSANRKIESLALMDVYGRVAQILLEHAVRDLDGRLVVRDKIMRTDLAKMIGASREMVTRAMGFIEERGYIEKQDSGAIVIHERLHSLI